MHYASKGMSADLLRWLSARSLDRFKAAGQ